MHQNKGKKLLNLNTQLLTENKDRKARERESFRIIFGNTVAIENDVNELLSQSKTTPKLKKSDSQTKSLKKQTTITKSKSGLTDSQKQKQKNIKRRVLEAERFIFDKK